MMALTVLALLCVAQATRSGSSAWLLGGAAALGLAFDVKLTESLVALPGLVLFAAFALPGSRRRRAGQLLACGAVYVVGRAGVAAGDARLPRPRATVRGRLQQRQRLERGARVQRRRPPGGQADAGPEHDHGRSSRHAPTLGATPASARASANRRSRSGLHRRAACSTAPGPCRATNSACWCWPRCCSACRRSPASCASAAVRDGPAGDRRPADRAPAAVGARGAGAVDGAGGRPVQPDGPPASALHARASRPPWRGRSGSASPGPARGARPVRLGALAVCLIGLTIYVERLLFGTPAVWWVVIVGALGALAVAAFAGTAGTCWALALALAEPAGGARLGLGAGDRTPHHRHQPARPAAARGSWRRSAPTCAPTRARPATRPPTTRRPSWGRWW